MDQPQRTRLALAITFVLGAVAIVGIVLATRHSAGTPAETSDTASPPPPEPAPPPPPPSLRRADLTAIVARTASAYAAGKGYPQDNRELEGRRFELVIPFGCEGAGAAPLNPAQWTLNEKEDAITFTVRLFDWTEEAWVRSALGPGDYDRIEGFWLPRPWLATETCPPQPSAEPPPAQETASPEASKPEDAGDGKPPSTKASDKAKPEASSDGEAKAPIQAGPSPAAPSMGFVREFDSRASRIGQRRNRPYSVVLKAGDERAAPPRQFQLVVAGRITPTATGEIVVCRTESVDRPPTCLMNVALDRVAVIEPRSRATIAEWTE